MTTPAPTPPLQSKTPPNPAPPSSSSTTLVNKHPTQNPGLLFDRVSKLAWPIATVLCVLSIAIGIASRRAPFFGSSQTAPAASQTASAAQEPSFPSPLTVSPNKVLFVGRPNVVQGALDVIDPATRLKGPPLPQWFLLDTSTGKGEPVKVHVDSNSLYTFEVFAVNTR